MPPKPRRSGQLRHVARRPDGTPCIRWGHRDWTAPALRYVPDGTGLYAVPAGAHRLDLYEARPRQRRAERVLEPLCTARPAKAPKPQDPAQLPISHA